jgi:hypothetical protein
MPSHEIGLGQADVAADHFESRVPQDLLQAEDVATIDQVGAREGVAEGVRAAASADARPLA